MTKKLRPIWTYVFFFTVGFLIATLNFNIQTYAEMQNPTGNTIEQVSPGNWIKEDQIEVTSDKITINIKGAKWAKFTDTNSMDPLLDENTNAIQLIPQNETQLIVGDIITYNKNNQKIIHRIIQIGNDGKWYAITKGDNNAQPDPEKVRFEDIEKVLVGIIY